MTDKEREDHIAEIDFRSTCKRFCDDINQRLNEVDSSRPDRAIWELFQNAGDTAMDSPEGKRAFLRMTLTEDEFIFAHKGVPFTYDTLSSLVKQVSSRSKEDDEGATGQYGTGFVTTHLFGKVLKVGGSLVDTEHTDRYIDIDNLVIDRMCGMVKDEFYEKMKDQLMAVRDLALRGAAAPHRREWTTLTYSLETAIGGHGGERAQKALDAAVKTMPYLMTINPRIHEVEIDNQVSGERFIFRASALPDEEGVKVTRVVTELNGTATETKVYYIESESGDDIIILPLATRHQARRFDGIAKLFVNYPLLGSENFGFEFIFQSRRFFPEEKRDGLYLPKEDANVPDYYKHNKAVLNEMTDMLFDALSDIQDSVDGWEEVLALHLAAPQGCDKLRKDFYNDLKAKWVKFFDTLRVFDIDGEKQALADSNVRLYSGSLLTSIDGDNEIFAPTAYQAARLVGNTPAEELIRKWSKVVATWHNQQHTCFIDIEDLAQEMAKGTTSVETLLEFDNYLVAADKKECFKNCTLIPNRSGELRKVESLLNAEDIPYWLGELLMPFLPQKVEKFVDGRFVDLYNFSKYSRNDIRAYLRDSLEALAKSTIRLSGAKKKCSHENLLALALLSMIAYSESDDTIRSKVMKVVAEYLGIPYKLNILDRLTDDESDIAALPFKHLVENLLLEISLQDAKWMAENADFVHAFHDALSEWSVYYSPSEKKGLALDYAAFPDMAGNPCMAKYLQHGRNIPDELFSIYEAVMGQPLQEELVDPAYASFCEFEETDANAIAKTIENKLEENGFTHPVVLEIIKLLDKGEEWAKMFPRITKDKATLFMQQVLTPESKESVYAIMQLKDPDKLHCLAQIATDEDIDNLEDIIRLGKQRLAQENAEKEKREKIKQSNELIVKGIAEILYQKVKHIPYVGAHVSGQTIRVYKQEKSYTLYVQPSGDYPNVALAKWQVDECVEAKDSYALLRVDTVGLSPLENNEDVGEATLLPRITALPTIGELVADAETASRYSNDKVYIAGNYTCIVPSGIIERKGISFDKLVEIITEKCLA